MQFCNCLHHDPKDGACGHSCDGGAAARRSEPRRNRKYLVSFDTIPFCRVPSKLTERASERTRGTYIDICMYVCMYMKGEGASDRTTRGRKGYGIGRGLREKKTGRDETGRTGGSASGPGMGNHRARNRTRKRASWNSG